MSGTCVWLAVACIFSASAGATTFTVSSTSSSLSDAGSLAYALNAANDNNNNDGPDVVIIDLPPAAGNLIILTAPLPNVTGPIDLRGGGVTISGAQLAGASSAGLVFDAAAAGSTLSDMQFANFPASGVYWAASDGRVTNVTIFGCRTVGLYLAGNRNVVSSSVFGNATAPGSRGNDKYGVQVDGQGNVVRGCVISGNSYGLVMVGSSNVVQGNIIGMDVAGKVALRNAWDGIRCSTGSDNTSILDNTISGNHNGVYLASHNNVVRGNNIGLDMSGSVAVGNRWDGIQCDTGSDSTTIANNTVSGNMRFGIFLASHSTVVQGNIIGLDPAGKAALGNRLEGISCYLGCDNTTIAENIISGNRGGGVNLGFGTSMVRGNIIGLDATGRESLGNAVVGVYCASGSMGTSIINNTISSNWNSGVGLASRNNVVHGNIIGLDLTGNEAAGNSHGISCEAGSDNTTITNNTIGGNKRYGISLSSSSNVVRGNIVGLDVAGRAARGNVWGGINCDTGSGRAAIVNNTVSGNLGHGLTLACPGSVVQGNIIGLDVAGNVAVGNAKNGIYCDTGSDNTVIANNTVSGNNGSGVELNSTRNSMVQANLIGLDVAGSVAVGNALDGIICDADSKNATIAGNTVSGNLRNGVFLAGLNHSVQGNIIGLDVAGTAGLGNTLDGIQCISDGLILVNNTVSGNLRNGVFLNGSRGSAVQGNIIGLDVTGRVAIGNANDGILCGTGSTGTSITNNTVGANGGFGVNLRATNTSSLANSFLGNHAGTLNSSTHVSFSGQATRSFSSMALESSIVLPGANGTLLLEVYAFDTCAGSLGRGIPVGIINVSDTQAGARQFVRMILAADAFPIPPWASALATAITIEPWHATSSMSSCIPIVNTTNVCSGLCDCSGTTVNCSGRGLQVVPEGISANTTRLLLDNNRIFRLEPKDFAGLSAVTHLNLSGNPLDTDPTAGIPPTMAAGLQVLDLSRLDGLLSELDVFRVSDFPALRELDISGNTQLSALRAGAFSSATALQSVRLDGCALTAEALMQADMGALSLITQLDLSNNRLTHLPSEFLVNATSLSELRLHSNNISFVADDALRGAPALRVLDIGRQTTAAGDPISIPPGQQLVGLHTLQAVRWTSAACPAGVGLGLVDEAAGIYICLPCADGTYLEAGGGSLAACRTCPSGWTDDDRDPATPCVACDKNHTIGGVYTASGSVGGCQEEHQCPAGTVDDDHNASTPCKPCAVGSYSSIGQAGSCSVCAAGTVDDDLNPATPCVGCPNGTYVPPHSTGPCALFKCSAGSVDNDANPSTPCVVCGPGHFSPAGSVGPCSGYACPAGFWDNDNTSSTACVPVPAKVKSSPSSSLVPTVAGALGGLVVLLVVLGLMLYRRQWRALARQRRELAELRERATTRVRDHVGKKLDLDRVIRRLEVPRTAVTTERELGSGDYGVVELGVLQAPGGAAIPVAIKRLKGDAGAQQQEHFLTEAWLTGALDHPHIVKMLAVCTQAKPFLAVLELLPGGDLGKFLQKAKPAPEAGLLLGAAVMLSDALCYLETMGVVHRDLAARNVLVGETLSVVKLADFGMSRDIEERAYYRQVSNDRVPVKWMAPEAIRTRRYSFASDVWSFGVLLWELFALGERPYASMTALETAIAVGSGYRLERPPACPEAVYALMRGMWALEPAERPAMPYIRGALKRVAVERQVGGSTRVLSPVVAGPTQMPVEPAQSRYLHLPIATSFAVCDGQNVARDQSGNSWNPFSEPQRHGMPLQETRLDVDTDDL